MSFKEWKEAMRDEWEFYKRNPEFPIMMSLCISLQIFTIFHE